MKENNINIKVIGMDYIELHLNNYCTLFILKEDRFYFEPTIYSKEDVVKSIIFEDLEIKLNDIFM